MQLGAEQVDALAAGDLGVEVVFLRHRAEGDQLVRGDLAAGDARHHRVGAVLLHVGHEGVVGVLQRHQQRVGDRLVPAGGEDRADRRLADVATGVAAAVLGQQFLEADHPLHPHDGIQLLTGVGEVLAEALVDGDATSGQLAVEYQLEQRAAAAAAGGRLGLRLEFAEVGDAGLDLAAHRALADVVAGADGRAVRQRIGAQGRRAFGLRQDQAGRIFRQGDAVLRVLQQGVVVAVVADQHRAEHVLAIGGND
ncbi:hypothetical protein D3C84_608980 [compost metagenome]